MFDITGTLHYPPSILSNLQNKKSSQINDLQGFFQLRKANVGRSDWIRTSGLLVPKALMYVLSNGFRWFSALSAQVEMVSDGHDSTDSGCSGRDYGQICGQITQHPIWLILSHNPETAVLQYKSAEIASGWPFFDVQKLRCGKQRNTSAAQF